MHIPIPAGQKFGDLTTVRFIGRNKNGDIMYECTCNCGNTFCRHTVNISASSLRTGHTKSCGAATNLCKPSIGNIPYWLYRDAKRRARHRKIEFNVSHAYLDILLQNQRGLCALTGFELFIGRERHPKETNASLDRIDSSKGYTPDNVQFIHDENGHVRRRIYQMVYCGCAVCQ